MKKTLQEVSGELYGALDSLKSEFEGQEGFDEVFGALHDVENPGVTQNINGTGGTAAIEVEVVKGWESGNAVGRLKAIIRQFEEIGEALMDNGQYDVAKVYRDHGTNLEEALDCCENKNK